MNCFPVFGTLSRHFRSLFRKVNQFTENPRHFPPISLRLSPSICIHSPFLVCPSRESAPICREFEALSPGTKLDNRFCGYSACILRPSYQGKVHQFVANPRHFPPRYTHCAFSFFVSTGKVNQISTNPWHFPLENLIPGTEWSDNETCLETCHCTSANKFALLLASVYICTVFFAEPQIVFCRISKISIICKITN